MTTCSTTQSIDLAILERNLRAIARRSPRTARVIAETLPRTDITFTETDESGRLSGQVEGRSLASRRRPMVEAERLADTIDLRRAGGVAVLGFGLGYHVEVLAERAREVGAIVVFEPDVPLLRAVLERIDHSSWLERSPVILITHTNRGGISQALRGLEAPLSIGIEIVEHPPSRVRLGEQGAAFADAFTKAVSSMRTHIITTMMQMDVTIRNELMNLDRYLSHPGINELAGLCAGRPAVVVSAGPSLRRNLHLLEDPLVRERCVIVAVQTVLKPLLERGIRPHFVTALDYHEISRRFYEGLSEADVRGVTLIAEPKANPAILDAYPGQVRMLGDAFLDGVLGRKFVRPRACLQAGATVAHMAYYVARYLGSDPVILMGQDLAFTDGQYYARGAAIHEVWACELNSFNTLEMMEWQRIVRGRQMLHRVKDHLGRDVYTDEQMATYLNQFERDFLSDHEQGLTTIDATEGGVQKASTLVMTLGDALGRYAPPSGPPLPEFPEARDDANEAELFRVRHHLSNVRRDVLRIVELCERTDELLIEVAEHHEQQTRVNELIDRIHACRDEVEQLSPAYGMVHRLNQTGALKRFRADRDIRLDDSLDPKARQLRQVERDRMNVTWLRDSAVVMGELLDATIGVFNGDARQTRDIPLSALPEPDAIDAAEIESSARLQPTATVVATVPMLFSHDHRAGLDGSAEFMGEPMGRRTIRRLLRCDGLRSIIVLTDDVPRARKVLGDADHDGRVTVRELKDRSSAELMRRVQAARSFSPTSWRGGIGNTTCYDEALLAREMLEVIRTEHASGALIVGATWCLVDPELCDQLIERFGENPRQHALTFCQAAPGLAGCVASAGALQDLVQAETQDPSVATIGAALGYLPTRPRTDPIAKSSCLQIDPTLRDAMMRFIPDSPVRRRSLELLLAERGLNAERIDARTLAGAVRLSIATPEHPEEITIELVAFGSPDCMMDGAVICRILDQLGEACSAATLTLTGRPDSMVHPDVESIVRQCDGAGFAGIHLRTSLDDACEPVERMLEWPIDVVSIDLHASDMQVYQHLTGRDDWDILMGRMERLLQARRHRGGMLRPWIVPRITRRDLTYEQIESFYDRWLMFADSCIIDQLPAPIPYERIEPLGKPRRTLERDAMRRLWIGADGAVHADELMRSAESRIGNVGEQPLGALWEQVVARRQAAIAAGDYDHPDLRTGW